MRAVTPAAAARIGSFFLLILAAALWYLVTSLCMPGESYAGKFLPLAEDEEESKHRLRADVEFLCSAAPRDFTNPPGLEAVTAMLRARLSELGYSTRLQAVPPPPWMIPPPGSPPPRFWNVVAEKAGLTRPSEIIVVGAHYDTDVDTGGPGADDNASGVAAMLEVAKYLSDVSMERTLRFVAFVNEEPPFFRTEYMGSHLSAMESRAMGEDIKAMLALEMVGYYISLPSSQQYPYPFEWLLGKLYPSEGDFVAFVSDRSSRHLLYEAIRLFRSSVPFPSEGLALPRWVTGVDWSDHSSYWNHGYPALMVTDTAMFRNYRYHTRLDTPSTLDYGKMARLCSGLSEVVEELSGLAHP